MSVDWSRLEHAYGSAADVPQFFEEVADPELADEAWVELWSCLCHQGTVYPASFAALPVLADIATGRKPGDHWQAIALAGCIVVGERRLHEQGYARARYPDAIAELHRMAQHYLTKEPFEGDEEDYFYPLRALLAFEGAPVCEYLLPRLYDVECPSCSASLEIDFTEDHPGTRRRDPHGRLNFRGPTLTDARPVAPAELRPLASRLYRMAIQAAQSAAAEHLTYLFGHTTCPECDKDFSLPEQIEAFLSEQLVPGRAGRVVEVEAWSSR